MYLLKWEMAGDVTYCVLLLDKVTSDTAAYGGGSETKCDDNCEAWQEGWKGGAEVRVPIGLAMMGIWATGSVSKQDTKQRSTTLTWVLAELNGIGGACASSPWSSRPS